MNLHGLVRNAIQTVNPDIEATLLRSTGSTTGASGKQVPSFTATTVRAQVQAASGKDIERANNLGYQGVFRTVFLYGDVAGIVRADQTGGDLLKFPPTPGAAVRDWKVASVKETWPDWCCVVVCMQTTTVAL